MNSDFYTFERVKLNPDGARMFPHLYNLEGWVKDFRRHGFLGMCHVVRFPVGWWYIPDGLLTSIEGQDKRVPTYRALSLWQPYATLIAWGEKQWETRGWPTDYRGILAIHAAARKPTLMEIESLGTHWPATIWEHAAVKPSHYLKNVMPLGAVVCLVNVVDCKPTEKVRSHIGSAERAFGNYAPGRFAWKLEVVKTFTPAIPAKGKQGWWTWSAA